MSFQLEWLGHSCIMLNINNKYVVVDPFLDSNPNTRKRVSDLRSVDYILLTHGHWDHVSEAIMLAKSTQASVVCIPELAFHLKRMYPALITIEMGVGGSISLQERLGIDVRVKIVPAIHSSSIEYDNMKHYAGIAVGFFITIPITQKQVTLYHAGDTALTQEMKNLLHKVDIALLPVDGHYNLEIADVPAALEWIQPKIFIPIHYNTFPAIQIDVHALPQNPYGKTIILDKDRYALDLDGNLHA